MITTVTRDPVEGKLYLDGQVSVLRGGSYDLFHDPGSCPAAICRRLANGVLRAHIVPYTDPIENPCQKQADKDEPVVMDVWREPRNPQGVPLKDFAAFFGRMTATRCNFVRVFLGGATMIRDGAPVTISPFVRATVRGGVRYDMRGAVEGDRWNGDYFARLHAFVQQADAAGVVVQLALFTYRELAGGDERGPVKTWSYSPWRADNSMDGGWATGHLIPPATLPPERQRQFVAPPEGRGTRRVQEALIRRVVQEVAGFGNVVLEVMNEPRASLPEIAAFNSFVAGRVLAFRPAVARPAPLLSVNASLNGAGTTDMDVWRGRQDLPHYAAVDLVRYHAMTALGHKELTACGGPVKLPRVDPAKIRERAGLHLGAHSDPGAAKALMFSTDAVDVKRFTHEYAGDTLEMNVRDGQILTEPTPVGAETLEDARLLRSHVYHWAKWSLGLESGVGRGRVHLHNDATFRLALVRIATAARELGLQPAAAGAPESEAELTV